MGARNERVLQAAGGVIRPKVVRYWIMEPGNGRAEPRNEVDAIRWASLEEAATLLTYPRDREILTAFASAVR
jgi:hypothetical protein